MAMGLVLLVSIMVNDLSFRFTSLASHENFESIVFKKIGIDELPS